MSLTPASLPLPAHPARTSAAPGTAASGAAARAVKQAWATAAAVAAESRPAVQWVVALRLICTTEVLVQPSARRVVVALGWLLLSVAVYTFNGLTDVDADRSNGSSRPIASGRLPVAAAAKCCVALLLVGYLSAVWAGPMVAAAALGYLVLGWAYSAGPCLKDHRHGSALAIGGGAGLTYAAGWATAHRTEWQELVLALLLSIWIGAGSMSKDFSDVEGDSATGRRTAPVLLGGRSAARRLAWQAILTSVGVTVLAVALHSWIASAPGLVLIGGSVVLALTARRFGSDGRRAVRRIPYRVFMCTQYLADATLLVVLAR